VRVKDHKQIMLSFPTVANFFPDEENLAIQTSSLCLDRIAIAITLIGEVTF